MLLTLLPGLADMAPIIKQGGPFLVPVRAPHVLLETEQLLVRMGRKSSRISADFALRNTGEAQRVLVAFPQITSTSPRNPGPGVWDVGVSVDGRHLPFQTFHGRLDRQNNRYMYFEAAPKKWLKLPVELGSPDTYNRLSWLTWELRFAAGQSRRIQSRYTVQNRRVYTKAGADAQGLTYLLKTASLWGGGRIGSLRAEIGFTSDYSLHLLNGSAPDWGRGYLTPDHYGKYLEYQRLDVSEVEPAGSRVQIEGQDRLVWDLADWTPANLQVNAVSYFAMKCSSVLDKSLAYGPQRLVDGDPSTAWVPARAVGEWAQVPLVLPEAYRTNFGSQADLTGKGSYPHRRLVGLRIWNGYGKSDDLFAANNRPRKIRLTLCRSFFSPAGKGPFTDISLEDRPGWQEFTLPEKLRTEVWAAPGSGDIMPTCQMHVKILDVYRGTRFNDTCLSEVEPVF